MLSESELSVVILAAGQGTRMRGDMPKVLFPLCGRPMIGYVLDAVLALSPRKVVPVVGYNGDRVVKAIESSWSRQDVILEFAWQAQQKGTGDAVICAKDAVLEGDSLVLVLCGDTPLITADLLLDFLRVHNREGADLSLITANPTHPSAYGRIIRNSEGNVSRIVEARDLPAEWADVMEVNAGIYLARASFLFCCLEGIGNDNAKGEYYLTDVVHLASSAGRKVNAFACEDARMVLGVNDRWAMAQAEGLRRKAILKDLALSGVTVRDPSNTYVDWGVTVGPDTVLEPNTHLKGNTTVGPKCVIGPGTLISNSVVGAQSQILMSAVEDSHIEAGVSIGPFSHLRPNTRVGPGVLIGNFAEVKNTVIGSGTKVHHHSYLGDSVLGEGVNIGAGAITVNYDGVNKHTTTIGDRAFIGCNANLIAPVVVGDGSYVAAGSTVSDDVPAGSLAIARGRQVNKEGWVEKKRKEKGQGRNQ